MFRKKNAVRQPVNKGVVKVPVIMQLEALECGAASLCMAMAYFGRWIPLEQMRKECGVSRDGSNLKSIYIVAESYGLIPDAYRYNAESLRDKGTFPCIAFWEYNHFVVVDGFKGNYVYLNDPARGEIRITFDEFKQSYSGICLLLKPSEKFEPAGQPESILKFAAKRLKGTLPMFMLVIMTTLITMLIGILTPAFSRFFVDQLLTGDGLKWSGAFFWGLAVLSVMHVAAVLIRAVYMLKLQGKMAIVANTSFLWHVLRLPVEFFSQRMAGDIVQRQQSNGQIANVLIDTFAPVMLDVAAMLFNLFLMIDYSPVLASVGILSVILSLVLAQYISQKRINITRVQMRDSGKLYGTTVSGIDMIETIKSAGAENGFFMKWAGYQASCNDQTVKYARLNQYLGQLPELLSLLTANIILFLGVRLIMQGNWTIGMISAFNGYLSAFTLPAQSLIRAGQSLQEMRTQMERVEDVLKYKTDIDYRDTSSLTDEELYKLNGLVELKNVTFGYNRLLPPLLKDFSMRVEPGESVAIVGASGCGKSTIAKLITGLYSAWSGEILFGCDNADTHGRPINEINRSIFTGSVACVDQDISMFEDTIANNIRMWDRSIEDFAVIVSARDAKIHDDIIQRDGDYSSPVLEGGKNFSGGQRQRIEIARVLAQDPTIIIMDEATSALDAQTEHEIMKSVAYRGITRIIISHRLSIIRDCEEIIVMNNGQVIARGTHDDLMKSCEYYAAMITNE